MKDTDQIAAEAAEACIGRDENFDWYYQLIQAAIEKAVKSENELMMEFYQGQREIAFRKGQESRAAQGKRISEDGSGASHTEIATGSGETANSASSQLTNEILSVIWRYSQESDITIGESQIALQAVGKRLQEIGT